jgi:hypothetical protein
MKDFAIQLTHRPGELARVAAVLSHRGVNLKSVAGLAIGNHVIIRLIPDDVEATRAAFESAAIRFEESEVVPLVLEHRAGELALVSTRLAEGGVNLRAIYLMSIAEGLVELAIVPDNPSYVKRLLQ